MGCQESGLERRCCADDKDGGKCVMPCQCCPNVFRSRVECTLYDVKVERGMQPELALEWFPLTRSDKQMLVVEVFPSRFITADGHVMAKEVFTSPMLECKTSTGGSVWAWSQTGDLVCGRSGKVVEKQDPSLVFNLHVGSLTPLAIRVFACVSGFANLFGSHKAILGEGLLLPTDNTISMMPSTLDEKSVAEVRVPLYQPACPRRRENGHVTFQVRVHNSVARGVEFAYNVSRYSALEPPCPDFHRDSRVEDEYMMALPSAARVRSR